MNPPGSISGTIVASPSKQDPNYFYDWIRDSALVYNALNNLNDTKEYVKSTIIHQMVGDFGEPKFYIDGKVYDKPWGRPQTDGPGLRTITLYTFIQNHLKQGGKIHDLHHLYNPNYPPDSIIKKDLEYIAHNYNKQSFDLWEEFYGNHFYNLMIHQRALEIGSEIADLFNDPGASAYYKLICYQIRKELNNYWDETHMVVTAIKGQQRLDIAIVLACLHSSGGTFNLYACKSDRILISLAKLHASFQVEYPVNYGHEFVLYGRYNTDEYDGTGKSVGNPWILSTFGVAELLYRIGLDFHNDGYIDVTSINLLFYQFFIPRMNLQKRRIHNSEPLFYDIIGNLTQTADGITKRVLGFGERFSEQIDRNMGFMKGAVDLSWAYASFVTAYDARQRLIEKISSFNKIN
jgi:glucoamylase